jgi:biopolymer transport protein ExbB
VLNTLINYSVQSMGLIPLLAVIFLLGMAVIIERLVFFARAVRAGKTIEHDLKLLKANHPEDAAKLVKHYESTVQAELVKTAIKVNGRDEACWVRSSAWWSRSTCSARAVRRIRTA